MTDKNGDLKRAESELDTFLMDIDAEYLPSNMTLANKIDLVVEECQSLFFENMIFNIALENKLGIDDVEYLSELMQDVAEEGAENFEMSEEGLQSIIDQVRKRGKNVNKH